MAKLPVSSLQEPHREIFQRAIVNVAAAPVAEITYGQIIDGVPLSRVARDRYSGVSCPGHPLLREHLELSAEVLEKARQIRSSFDSNILELDAELLHAVAVRLFKQGPLRPKDDPLLSWEPKEDVFEKFYTNRPLPPTLFSHKWYPDHEQYPEGLADVVGYWAENHILGGVVLFDRRGESAGGDTSAVYFHSDRKRVTYRIYRLLDEQKQKLLEFLLAEEPSSLSWPLPISGDLDNRTRVDPEDPISETGIYRDLWERKPVEYGGFDPRTKDAVVIGFNYVSEEDEKESRERGFLAQEKYRTILREENSSTTKVALSSYSTET